VRKAVLLGEEMEVRGDATHLIGEVVVLDGLEVDIELIDERDGGGDVELGDLRLRHVVQVLHERPQAATIKPTK